MPKRITIVAIFLSILIFIFVIELVRKRKLKEEFSLLWILTGSIIWIAAIWEKPLFWIARLIGIEYTPSVLFLFGLLFLIIINIYYSIRLSSLTENLKNVTQKVAILEKELKEKNTRE